MVCKSHVFYTRGEDSVRKDQREGDVDGREEVGRGETGVESDFIGGKEYKGKGGGVGQVLDIVNGIRDGGGD